MAWQRLTNIQSVDLTQLAKDGKLDPVIGRDEGVDIIQARVTVLKTYSKRYEEPYRVSGYMAACKLDQTYLPSFIATYEI